MEKAKTQTAQNTNAPSQGRNFGNRRGGFKKDGNGKKFGGQKEFDKKIVSIRRVTRVYKGGKRMRLSVVIVTGDKKGRVGIGIGKGADVKAAEEKAFTRARKNLVQINVKGRTIPHASESKFKAAKVLIKPAAPGTGIIAGSSVRLVMEMAGIKDILTKQLGANNPINNAYAAIDALKNLRLERI